MPPAAEEWIGATYAQDKALVMEKIRGLIAAGLSLPIVASRLKAAKALVSRRFSAKKVGMALTGPTSIGSEKVLSLRERLGEPLA